MINKNTYKNISLIALIFLLDRISKSMIEKKLELHQSYEIIKDFFSLTYVRNTGAGFSILQGQMWFFYLVSILVLIFLIYLLTKEKRLLYQLIYSFIIAGTLGNFYDRLNYRYVIDFFNFKIFNYNFPIFNIADIAITIGGFLILLDFLKKEKLNG